MAIAILSLTVFFLIYAIGSGLISSKHSEVGAWEA